LREQNFTAGFQPHLSNIAGRTAAKVSHPKFFSGAGFKLFCIIFGRLAAVATVGNSHTNFLSDY